MAAISSAAVLASSGVAGAVDGVLEINDASVMATGGYPAVISLPGSYVLTGNLTPPPGADGIVVFAANVTIDLNGFALVGAGGGGGSGVSAPGIANLTVRNGTITGFGASGVSFGPFGTVMKTRITGNSSGILGGLDCLVVENVIQGNGGGSGVDATRCKIENNVITDNAGVGISGGLNIIVHNQISTNVGGGILSLEGSTIHQNVIAANGGFGVSDGTGFPPAPFPGPMPPPPGPPARNVIAGNQIQGTLAGAGIALMLPAVIRDNAINSNFADGVICGADCLVQGNTIESNNVGGVGAGGLTVYAGSTVNDNAINDNLGYGLGLPMMAGYRNNTLNGNGPGGPDVVQIDGALAHPTAGFFNLCSGIPGPMPGLCP